MFSREQRSGQRAGASATVFEKSPSVAVTSAVAGKHWIAASRSSKCDGRGRECDSHGQFFLNNDRPRKLEKSIPSPLLIGFLSVISVLYSASGVYPASLRILWTRNTTSLSLPPLSLNPISSRQIVRRNNTTHRTPTTPTHRRHHPRTAHINIPPPRSEKRKRKKPMTTTTKTSSTTTEITLLPAHTPRHASLLVTQPNRQGVYTVSDPIVRARIMLISLRKPDRVLIALQCAGISPCP